MRLLFQILVIAVLLNFQANTILAQNSIELDTNENDSDFETSTNSSFIEDNDQEVDELSSDDQDMNEFGTEDPGMNEFASDDQDMNEFTSEDPDMNEFASEDPDMNEFASEDPDMNEFASEDPDMNEFASEDQDMNEFATEDPDMNEFASEDSDMNEFPIDDQVNEQPIFSETENNATEENFHSDLGDDTFAGESEDNKSSDADASASFSSNNSETINQQEISNQAEGNKESKITNNDHSTKATSSFIKEKQTELNQEIELSREKKWQNFNEIKKFIDNYNGVTLELGGTPPFSLLIEYNSGSKTASKVVNFVIQNKLVNESDREILVHNGKILIPQISEYSAIILSNMLQRFDTKITIGHAGDIYQSSITDQNTIGSPSKSYRKESYSGEFPVNTEIALTKNNYIKNIEIARYLGFVHAVKVITGTTSDRDIDKKIEHAVEQLITELKMKATKLNACAIINFERTIKEVNSKHLIIEGIGNAVEVVKNTNSESDDQQIESDESDDYENSF